jgi:hypothetical protein
MMVTRLAYCVDKELGKTIESLEEQIGVLKEQQEKDKLILLTNRRKIGLTTKAKTADTETFGGDGRPVYAGDRPSRDSPGPQQGHRAAA